MATIQKLSIWDPALVRAGLVDAVRKLDPRVMVKNPVMFVVEVGAGLTTILLIRDIVGGPGGIGFELQITLWLWATVLFANLAEAMAEGRGKAQADTLRKTRTETVANRFTNGGTETVPPAPDVRRHRFRAGEWLCRLRSALRFRPFRRCAGRPRCAVLRPDRRDRHP